MSDNTFPPNGPGPEGRPPQPGPYGGPPRQQNPYGGPPPQNPYGPPGQYGGRPPQGPPGGPGGPPQGPYAGGQQQNPYGAPQQNPYGPPGGPQSGNRQHGVPGHGPAGHPPYGPPPTGQQPYGGPAYGGPSYGGPPYGGPQGPQYTETMEWQPERRRKRGKLIPIIAAVAVLLVLGGGGAFAYSRIAGGGEQPAAALPGDTLAYMRVDLNPSAGQRVAALRFLMKFPSVKKELNLTGDNDDLKQKVFDAIKKSDSDMKDVDYEKDVKPWLGDRMGFAAIPGEGDKTESIAAFQLTNEGKAKTGIEKLFGDDEHGVAFLNGYAVVADNQGIADKAVAAAKQSPLSENATFKKDMDELGEQGFASAWIDTKGVATLMGDDLTEEQRKALPQGTMAAALRFDSQYVEVKGIVHGDKTLKPGKSNAEDEITNLPDSTAGAFAIADGETLVDRAWEQVQKASQGAGVDLTEMAKKFGEKYGIAIPADVRLLLGKNFVIAADKETGSQGPQVAAKMKTDPAKAEPVVDKIIAAAKADTRKNVPIQKAKDGDTLVVATSKQYADQVLKGGNLGDTEGFKLAIPESKGSVMIGYVDFSAIETLVPRRGNNEDLAVLRSAGITTRATGDGQGEFTLRVVAK